MCIRRWLEAGIHIRQAAQLHTRERDSQTERLSHRHLEVESQTPGG